MNTNKLIDIFIKEKHPLVYHVGGEYIREPSIDLAVLDTKSDIETIKNNLNSVLNKISDGWVFIPGVSAGDNATPEELEKTILHELSKRNNIGVLRIDTTPNSVYVCSKDLWPNIGIDPPAPSIRHNPAVLTWVRKSVCTMECAGPVDVVYTLADAPSPNDYEELKLSLRSVAKNGINVGEVWLVSKQIPEWATNVKHIRQLDTFNDCKDANIINKLLAACTTPEVSNRFIFMSDDQIINMPTDFARLLPTYNNRGLGVFINKGGNKWSRRMANTLRIVDARGGYSYINWDSHCPQPIDKEKFRDIMLSMPYTTPPGVCVNTAYFGCKLESPIVFQERVKNTFESTCTNPIVLNRQFVGFNDSGYSSGLRDLLLKLFDTPSVYERI